MADSELCPSCGEFTDTLVEKTGWCRLCSFAGHGTGGVFCEGCGNVRYSNPCSSCKEQNWLATNADAIERYIIAGLSFKEAAARVREEQAPICVNCGDKIKGTIFALFCTKKPECRRAKRIYRYKRDYHKLSVHEALTQTIRQLTGEDERGQLLRAV